MAESFAKGSVDVTLDAGETKYVHPNGSFGQIMARIKLTDEEQQTYKDKYYEK